MRTDRQTDREHIENSKHEATLIPVYGRGERANSYYWFKLHLYIYQDIRLNIDPPGIIPNQPKTKRQVCWQIINVWNLLVRSGYTLDQFSLTSGHPLFFLWSLSYFFLIFQKVGWSSRKIGLLTTIDPIIRHAVEIQNVLAGVGYKLNVELWLFLRTSQVWNSWVGVTYPSLQCSNYWSWALSANSLLMLT